MNRIISILISVIISGTCFTQTIAPATHIPVDPDSKLIQYRETVTQAGTAGPLNPGPHGFSEILYAFSSMGNNNGSAFAGLTGNTLFYNFTGSLAMLMGRFWLAIPTLAIAGSLARKKIVPISAGTMPTHTPLFVALLLGVVLIIGVLVFLPALGLGPIVEQLKLMTP